MTKRREKTDLCAIPPRLGKEIVRNTNVVPKGVGQEHVGRVGPVEICEGVARHVDQLLNQIKVVEFYSHVPSVQKKIDLYFQKTIL